MVRATLTRLLWVGVLTLGHATLAWGQPPSGDGSRHSVETTAPRGAVERAQQELGARRARRSARLIAQGQALARAGHGASALARFRQAIQVDPRAVAAYVGLTELYVASDRLGDAFDTIRVGLGRRPNHPELQRQLAALHRRVGESAEAMAILRDLVAQDGQDPLSLRAYAEAAEASGHWSEALRAIRALLRLLENGTSSVEPAAVEALRLRARALHVLAERLDGSCQTETPLAARWCSQSVSPSGESVAARE